MSAQLGAFFFFYAERQKFDGKQTSVKPQARSHFLSTMQIGGGVGFVSLAAFAVVGFSSIMNLYTY